jgi:hypothetical protein
MDGPSVFMARDKERDGFVIGLGRFREGAGDALACSRRWWRGD